VESTAPLVFQRKELRPASGGDGAQEGGLGQVIEFTVENGRDWTLNAVTSRLTNPPQGLFGGAAGAAGTFLVNGEPVRTQKRIDLRSGDLVRLELPGGGGYGSASAQGEVVQP
jgi:N-methylhydantoinase B